MNKAKLIAEHDLIRVKTKLSSNAIDSIINNAKNNKTVIDEAHALRQFYNEIVASLDRLEEDEE